MIGNIFSFLAGIVTAISLVVALIAIGEARDNADDSRVATDQIVDAVGDIRRLNEEILVSLNEADEANSSAQDLSARTR